jgi:hypothetical protein
VLFWFILRWLGEFHVMCGTHLFILSNVSQASLELVAAAMAVVVVATSPCWLCSRSQLLSAIKD